MIFSFTDLWKKIETKLDDAMKRLRKRGRMKKEPKAMMIPLIQVNVQGKSKLLHFKNDVTDSM